MAIDPGWIDNPFGRRRVFHKVDDEALTAANRREAGNYRIQSTVADGSRIACRRLRQLRAERELAFKLVNQMHDALMLMSPENEAEKAAKVLREAMETVEIPLPYGNSMTLKVSLEIFKRWGEKK
jgi:DNA polymerase I-like protein with 3'-5' exonuclease and polymerase domains